MGEGWRDTRPNDARDVQVHVVEDVNYWCAKYGCSEEDLRSAVNHAGTEAEAVKQYLMAAARSKNHGSFDAQPDSGAA